MAFSISKVFSQGANIAARWVFDTKAPLLCAAAATDSDHPIIIVGTKHGTLHCIGEDGKPLWSYNMQEKLGAVESFFVDEERVHSISSPPVIADVNMDGKQEVLAATELGSLYCLSLEGKLLWKH